MSSFGTSVPSGMEARQLILEYLSARALAFPREAPPVVTHQDGVLRLAWPGQAPQLLREGEMREAIRTYRALAGKSA